MRCRSASKDVVKAVLAAGPSRQHPSIRDVNKHGLTPLGEALVAGRCDVADLLVKEARDCCSIHFLHFQRLLDYQTTPARHVPIRCGEFSI